MNAEQYLKAALLADLNSSDDYFPPEPITAENIDRLFEDAREDPKVQDYLQDAESGIREGKVETGLPCESSRHYESKAVAMKMPDGQWVGWTYWYGGGKHGEPEAIDWMEDAYLLNCTEEEKTVVVQTFVKAEA